MSIAEGANAGSPRIFCAMMSLAVIFDLPNSSEILGEMFEVFRVLQLFLQKDFLGPETARKGTNSSSKRNPKTVIRSIYFHIKFGGKKRQHNNGVSGIDGKDGSLFLFCPKNSFFVLPIRESPPAMKLPAQVTMEISSYVSETCPKGLPTFSF